MPLPPSSSSHKSNNFQITQWKPALQPALEQYTEVFSAPDNTKDLEINLDCLSRRRGNRSPDKSSVI